MENIILTNNKDLRLVSVKVGVLSTLRFELPLVSASATHVEVIVTSGDVPSAYTATFIDATKRWQCDIAASQFPTVGRQSYEVAYVLDGKQFWDGKGWIEIEDATTSGIEPQPRPEPYRYAVVSVNGYGADAQGAVRIPKTFIATDSPTTTEGFMEGDIYFNRETGATWTLCNVQSTLTWVFNYKNYYTKEETDQQIDRVAAYYITYDAAGNPFPTYAALANATTVYSGGSVRVPTRNDYCVVLADETHQGAEYRYIYAVAEGATTGSWQAQFPVEGVMTVDQAVTKNSMNPVAGGGVWSAIWGALSALPTGFSSLYDWCVAQLAGKASTADATLTQHYTDWVCNPATSAYENPYFVAWDLIPETDVYAWCLFTGIPEDRDFVNVGSEDENATEFSVEGQSGETVVATRTASGYVLGSQTDKPLASEAEAVALRTGKMSASATGANILVGGSGGAAGSNIATAIDDLFRFKANLDSPTFTGTPVAPTAAAGENSTLIATTAFVQGAVPYALVTKTITNGAVTLDDRAINAVAVSSSLASLTVNFPTATSGKARDFGLRLTVASGITTAPELALPQGVVCENADGEAPEIGADGAATILYFTETASGVFLVKGEVLQTITA